jgi:hypothetical protein
LRPRISKRSGCTPERQTLSHHDRRVGARFGLGAAELFHYLVKDDAFTLMADNDLSDEIRSLETT